jgi:diamine N-acetyltransferase
MDPKPVISLEPLTAATWKDGVTLAVSKTQEGFVPSNLHSIAEAQFYPQARSRGVYAGDELVGYALYGIDEATGHWKIFRLMIGEQFQGKGYGKAAMHVLLEELRLEGANVILIKFHQANEVARKLYESLGFREVERTATHISAQCLLD